MGGRVVACFGDVKAYTGPPVTGSTQTLHATDGATLPDRSTASAVHTTRSTWKERAGSAAIPWLGLSAAQQQQSLQYQAD
ncbi:hypothetical protein FH972_022598 [Carpinus fangiana]|uniref:Uncharacterized protein n=1 Tax=Carpinus fangiana TaxID=176857 RepID=A0A5N6KSP9_9ROSI|nr:hypothetical protein FH972_022598 [Carpinus fangiana]